MHSMSMLNLEVCGVAARNIRADLDLALMSVHVMRFSTTDITATWLLPESVARIAGTLNYFLMHLTGVPPCFHLASRTCSVPHLFDT